jgi:hypothetical protein
VFGRPIVGSVTAIKSREEVAQRINWSPVGIPDVFRGGTTHVLKMTDFTSAELRKVTLGCHQRGLVGTTRKIGESKLDRVVLPETNWANVMRAWRLVEHQETATRAGKSRY